MTLPSRQRAALKQARMSPDRIGLLLSVLLLAGTGLAIPSHQAAAQTCDSLAGSACQSPLDPRSGGYVYAHFTGYSYFDGIYARIGDSLLQPARYWFVKGTSANCKKLELTEGCGHGVVQPVNSLGPLQLGQLLAAHRAGRPDSALPRRSLPQWWAGFSGLLPDSIAQPSPAPFPAMWKDKSVMVVLSTRTARSFAAIDDFRRQVVEWAARRGEPELQEAAGKLRDLPVRKLFADQVASGTRLRFARVIHAPDLSGLRSSGVDYALVVDLDYTGNAAEYLSRLDQAVRRNKPSDSPFYNHYASDGAEISWALLDREGRVLLSSIGLPNNWVSWSEAGNRYRSRFGNDLDRSNPQGGVALAAFELVEQANRLRRKMETSFPSNRDRVAQSDFDFLLSWIPVQPLP